MANGAAHADPDVVPPSLPSASAPRFPAKSEPAAIAPWDAVARAVVVSEGMAEAALAALENRRMRYTDNHRSAMSRIAAIAPELGRLDLQLRAELVLADLEFRRGDTVGSAEKVKEILAQAEQRGDTFIIARSHFLLCDIHHSLGDSPSARINGIRAVELLPNDAPTGIRIDHLRALSTAYGPGRDADLVNAHALDLTNVIGDAERSIWVHNTYAYFAYQLGDVAGARYHSEQMLGLSRIRQIPLVSSQMDTIARVMMMSGRNQEAIELLRPLIPKAGDPHRTGGMEDLDPKPYGLPECMLTLAEAHRALGRYVTAQRALAVAMQVGEERHLGRFRARAHLVQAAQYADIGDFQRAYQEHIVFHQAVAHLHSDEMEARSRLIQATFDAKEKRRDVENFRELALRDSLTGLYNRRFLDDSLENWCGRSAESEMPLSVAIVDADFFKRVNDELSHEVGDEVLRTLASLLAEATHPPELLGRLGGEEFLLVLPGLTAEQALVRCETVRRVVAEHDFSPITGTLPITVSIGVATVHDGRATPSELLAAADRNLYAAKRSGRNRVIGVGH